MAATRLIALHMNKGRTLAKCLKDRTDYEMNPDKTEQGKYISSYACDPKTVVEEFILSKREYEQKTGKHPKGDVIAYQIRQSFKPGEITPEEANRIGYETAMRFTKGNHAFVVSTHTDKAHVHNHVIFNSTALSGDRKFKDFLLSGMALGRLSNLICMENGLSVIAPQPYHSKTTYIHEERGPTFRDRLRESIDVAFSKKPGSFEDLLSELTKQGYEIKRGKHTAVRGNGQQRFIRFRSLGDGYTEKELHKKLEGVAKGTATKEVTPEKTEKPFYRDDKFDLLINIQDIIAQGKGPGYEMWAKKFNVKNVMKAILFFQEKGLRTYSDLEKMAGDTSDRFSQLSDEIKGYESRLKKISEQKKIIKDYSSTKEIYQQYRQSGYSKRFFEEHKEAIMTHKAAKDAFDKHKGKFPSYKELSAEYDEVLSKKRAAYAEYKEVRKDMQTYQTAKYDIDQILGIGKEQQQNKNRERSR
jgi:hypothetical protein